MEFLSTIWSIIVFLLVLTTIISIHELGHFLLARRAKILIHEFAIGMGPVITQKKKGDTFYSLRAIPLGGFVSMSGENGDFQLIKKNQFIGLNLNEVGLIKEIILDNTIPNPSVTGKVLDFDLYGENLKELFIEIETQNGEINRYQVLRNAKYRFQKKKEMQLTPHESSFASKSLWDRFLVIFCGPLMNFILALAVLFIVAAVQGKPLEHNIVDESSNPGLKAGDVILEINGTPTQDIYEIRNALSNVVSNKVLVKLERDGIILEEVQEVYVIVIMQNFGLLNTMDPLTRDTLTIGGVGGKAKAAGIKPLDVITHINNQPVTSWDEIITLARNYEQDQITVTVNRNGETITASYDVLSESTLNAIGEVMIDVRLGFSVGNAFDFGYLFTYPFQQFGQSVVEMVATLGLLFNPSSEVGVGDLAGPVGIFSLVSNAASAGFVNLLIFVAFLSVNIGLFNLLPIPALDGGRLIFLGYEAITRKKVPAKVELWVNNAFFFLLMALFVFVTFNDIGRLFS